MIVGGKEKSVQIKANNKTAGFFIKKYIGMRIIIIALSIVAMSGLYLMYAWNRYQDEASSQAIELAEAIESAMPKQHISKLSGSAEDIDNPEYITIKKNLSQLVEATNPIHFAYLMAERAENIIILMDSESPDSLDYSQPGQVYEEADDVFREPFKTGQTILTKPVSDRWGTWICVLVPVKEATTNSIVAVFGVDYLVSEWYAQIWRHMISDIIIVLFFIILSFTLLYGWVQYTRNNDLSKKLSISEAFYRNVFDKAPIGIAIVDDNGVVPQSDFGVISINSMFGHILGRTRADLANINLIDITHPEDLREDLDKFQQFKKGEISGYSMEKRYLRPDGSYTWVKVIISTFLDTPDMAPYNICIIQDISKRKEMENQIKESERKHAVLLSNLPGLAYRCNYDHEWTMQFVSDGCYELTGYTADSILNNREISFNDLIMPEYREILWNEWKRILAKKQPFRYEYEITTATGERKWVIETGQGIYNDAGEVEALEGIVFDISDLKEMENHLRYMNEHDRWTGLYNREYLESLLEKDKKQIKTLKRALMAVNLSKVQLLTSNYGFHYTQSLMKKVADTLNAYNTEDRMLFRTYENRFTFYLKNYKDKNELIDFSKTIANELKELLMTERVGGGIGVIEIEQDNEYEVDLLLRRLLIASEKSISEFGEDFTAYFYNDVLEKSIIREEEIRQELSRIAADDDCGDLFLNYQPILDLKTDSICGFEALARLKTEKLGFVSPVEFIPIAEETKLIIPIGQKVIYNAFRFLNKLKDLGHEEIYVAINISAIQLFKPDFSSKLCDMIREMNVNPQNIDLEITESIFTADYSYINNIISKLRDLGLHIAIDDFGTGFSSLARERELNVDCLKIDKYFIDKLMEVEAHEAITGDIISMAHRLGHFAIAEGVEYEEQKQYLLSHGCDRIQGYLVGKPLGEEEAFKLLAK